MVISSYQDTSSLRKPFYINSALYIDDGVSLFSMHEETEQATQFMHDHMNHFGLQIYVGSGKQTSKMEAMFFPTTLMKAKKQSAMNILDIMLNNGTNNIHFINTFKYIGSIISSDLTEDAKIEARINKASS